MQRLKQYFLLVLLLFFIAPQLAEAQLFKRKDNGLISKIKGNKSEQHIDIFTLTLDENKEVPEVGSPIAHKKISEYMLNELKRLQKVKGISVVAERNNEILKATIPMDRLFLPNDTALWSRAELVLRPFVRYGEEQGMFHILIVTHSDDTGSVDYSLALTLSRSKAIKQWLLQNGATTTEIVEYAMGAEDPVCDNSSMENRYKNRRAEIYIIPAERIVALAKRAKLSVKK